MNVLWIVEGRREGGGNKWLPAYSGTSFSRSEGRELLNSFRENETETLKRHPLWDPNEYRLVKYVSEKDLGR